MSSSDRRRSRAVNSASACRLSSRSSIARSYSGPLPGRPCDQSDRRDKQNSNDNPGPHWHEAPPSSVRGLTPPREHETARRCLYLTAGWGLHVRPGACGRLDAPPRGHTQMRLRIKEEKRMFKRKQSRVKKVMTGTARVAKRAAAPVSLVAAGAAGAEGVRALARRRKSTSRSGSSTRRPSGGASKKTSDRAKSTSKSTSTRGSAARKATNRTRSPAKRSGTRKSTSRKTSSRRSR
jgi:hypothetical protein